MLPFAIILAENHCNHFKKTSTGIQNPSGIILRQIWLFMSLVISVAFVAVVRAILIKESPPHLLQSLDEVINSGRAVLLTTFDNEDYEFMKSSPAAIDNYLFNNAQKVYLFSR